MTILPQKCRRKKKLCILVYAPCLPSLSTNKSFLFIYYYFFHGRFRRWETNEIKRIFKDIISIYWFWSLVETNEITMKDLSTPSKN
jgi:hypothetical protein